MKQILIISTALILSANIYGQSYFSFPTDTANWNCLYWHQWSPVDIHLTNTTYQLQGDTLINGKIYNKIFYTVLEQPWMGTIYIGGLREDSIKNIYFFPVSETLPTVESIIFPNDSTEHLLYTFNNIDSGMVLPINVNNTTIKVMGVDSVLIGNEYRKKYEIYNNELFGDYWVEGIGSTKHLLSSFSYEFEWSYYLLCYSDSITYYINSPNGEDSCRYRLPLGINEFNNADTDRLYPNPASESITINVGNKNGFINIYNSLGKLLISEIAIKSEIELNLKTLNSGIYIVEFINDKEKTISKFIKK